MIADIANAIMNHYGASSDLKDALSGLYFQQAPQDVIFPFAVFYIIGISHDEIMSNTSINNIVNADLQFNLFSDSQDGGTEIASVSKLLDEAFHWAEINVANSSRIKMQRQTILPSYADEIWQVAITYELSFQKS